MNIVEAATFSASFGLVLPKIVESGRDTLADGWNKESNPDVLVNLLDVVGRVSASSHVTVIHQLIMMYSLHYPEYEQSLIQLAVKASHTGTRPNSLRKSLTRVTGAYAKGRGPWVPLHVASAMLSPLKAGTLSHLHALASFESSKRYPFNRKYIAVLLHQTQQPVTTHEYVKAAAKVETPRPNSSRLKRRR